MSFSGENIFTFDNGICLGGLVAFLKLKQDPELFHNVKILADNISGFVEKNGAVKAIIELKNKDTVQEENLRWSHKSGAFHAKIAEALVEFACVVPDGQEEDKKRYINAARKICTRVLEFQKEDGRFITDNRGRTQLHPHCYAAEGLLRVGIDLPEDLSEDKKRFIESARRATEWALGECIDGKIPQAIGPEGPIRQYYRSDALAEVIAPGSRFQQAGHLDERLWGPLAELANTVWSLTDSVRALQMPSPGASPGQKEREGHWIEILSFSRRNRSEASKQEK